ncbi:unnamed protein product [Vitrella brassicaformis CCMP3155]|uniref:Phospholipid/glycerol acyltransferase domain-containing protein n=2 Tax=Vitrella brassicaformis TaxID=1169539 RepID=A0A0G4GS53_VITBC|nr:unnamed protein product [Vitrella brassicaformis CCMP3155]|eukprot:CEM33442.1 unnamed protein product [Vitrella brassicaformis CCMP3155]
MNGSLKADSRDTAEDSSTAASGPSKRLQISPLDVLITVWNFSFFLLGGVISLVIQLLIGTIGAPILAFFPVTKMQLMSASLKLPLAMCVWFNPFWHLKVVRRYVPPPPGERGRIILSNHLSGVDPWICNAAIAPYTAMFVFKSGLLNIPVLGWQLALTGDIPIYFTKDKGGWGTMPGTTRKMFERVDEVVSKGIAVLAYPEGTRSRTGRLQPFKNGFFKYCVDSETDIQPMIVHCTPRLWRPFSLLMGPGTCYAAFGDPISCKGRTMEEVRKATREAMAQLLKLSPEYDEQLDAPMSDREDLAPQQRGTSSWM